MKTQWQSGWTITAALVTANLGSELYSDHDVCLWEIARNGVCACFKTDAWVPGQGSVEVNLVRNHPLVSRGLGLVILDHGEGFTDARIKKYLTLGPSMDDLRSMARGQHHGAAQKRIGRFATFALNEACHGGDMESGFHILTRTTAKGQVKLVHITPAAIEFNKGIEEKLLDGDSAELGPLKGIQGSFTAIVIPNPVYKTPEEIREALRFRIPRKPDLMFKLLIDGKQLNPPKLASRIVIPQVSGEIEAFLDATTDQEETEGVWLADAHTGLRVQFCPSLGPRFLPYPLFRRELFGDIFMPGLLMQQNTSRSGLKPQFLKSQTWKNYCLYLNAQVAPKAQALFGNEDVFGRDSLGGQVMEFVELCGKAWGSPGANGNGPLIDWVTKDRPPKGPGGGGRGSGNGGGGGNQGGKHGPENTKPRSVPIRIGERSYFLSKRQLEPTVLARVDDSNGEVIYLNIGGYDPWPPNRPARAEHFILKVFEAVGVAEYPTDPEAVRNFVADRRIELLKKTKK